MSGIIKYKPTDRDKYVELVCAYLDANSSMRNNRTEESYDSLKEAMIEVFFINEDERSDDYFELGNEKNGTIRYFKEISPGLRNRIIQSWKVRKSCIKNKTSLACFPKQIERLDKAILALSAEDVIDCEG